jgi:predicted protein tyrosine phosphatase
MGDTQKLLFICSHNLQRSPTAERLYDGMPGYEARSAGTAAEAKTKLTAELLEWADIVFVMEQKHIEKLRAGFKASLRGRRLICLDIPDKYGYMSRDLIRLLRERLAMYIDPPPV